MAKKTAKKPAKPAAIKLSKPPTKGQLAAIVAAETGLPRKAAVAAIASLTGQITKSLKSFGGFTLPGVAKFVVKKKPATPARKGINPFTKQEVMFKAKPASKVVRIRPVKAIKEAVK